MRLHRVANKLLEASAVMACSTVPKLLQVSPCSKMCFMQDCVAGSGSNTASGSHALAQRGRQPVGGPGGYRLHIPTHLLPCFHGWQ